MKQAAYNGKTWIHKRECTILFKSKPNNPENIISKDEYIDFMKEMTIDIGYMCPNEKNQDREQRDQFFGNSSRWGGSP